MRRIPRLLALAAALAALGWGLADLPGVLRIEALGYRFTAGAPAGFALLGGAFVGLYLLCRLCGAALRLPSSLRRGIARRRARRGAAASTRALLALAADDAPRARREGEAARVLLGDRPEILLVLAQAGHLLGEDAAAEAALRLLADFPDRAASAAGWRGLLRQAMARGDLTAAKDLADRAAPLHPRAPWLRRERARIAARTGDWTGLAAADADTNAGTNADAPDAVLMLAAAEREADPARAAVLAGRACRLDPGLTPAALRHAAALRAAGASRKAAAVLHTAWRRAPHPGLAEAFLDKAATPLERLRLAGRLTWEPPDHPESRFLRADLARRAGLTGEARRHVEVLLRAGCRQRRLFVLLADLAADEGGDAASPLRRALAADPDPGWRCGGCAEGSAAWRPACPRCGRVGAVAWTAEASSAPAGDRALSPRDQAIGLLA